jgi:hypothetical protein
MRIAFMDSEKALDETESNKLRNILYKCLNPTHLIETIKCLYKNSTIQIDISSKIFEEIFKIQGVGLGYSSSPTLFNI